MPSKKKKYKVTSQDIHVKNIVHEDLDVRNGVIIYEKWLFQQADFPCGGCQNSQDVVFMRLAPLNAVVRSCEFCGTTERVYPRHPQTNDPVAILLESNEISTEEARKVIERNGMKAKFMLPTLARLMKRKPIRRRKVDIDKLGLETEA